MFRTARLKALRGNTPFGHRWRHMCISFATDTIPLTQVDGASFIPQVLCTTLSKPRISLELQCDSHSSRSRSIMSTVTLGSAKSRSFPWNISWKDMVPLHGQLACTRWQRMWQHRIDQWRALSGNRCAEGRRPKLCRGGAVHAIGQYGRMVSCT